MYNNAKQTRNTVRYIIAIIFLTLQLSASIYYAKVEPYEVYSIKAAASGEVIFSDRNLEGKVSTEQLVVQLDDVLNKQDLQNSKQKLQMLQKTLQITRENRANSQKIADIREENYNKLKNLKTKSQVEKDNELINTISAKNQVLALLSSEQNLINSINDLEYKIAQLKDTIAKKNIKITSGFLIYKLYVNAGDYVNVGSMLVDAHDISKAKLTIFLSKEDVEMAKKSVIYINDLPSDLHIDKIWPVVDTQNISAYKAEIILPAPERFSELLKIELREK